MKTAIVTFCAGSLLIGPAFGADVELAAQQPAYAIPRRAMEWTGLYFGVNAGFGAARAETDIRFEGVFLNGSTAPPGSGLVDLSTRRVSGAEDLSGVIAGGQMGFNWLAGITLIGAEIDGQWSGRQATFTSDCGADCIAREDLRIRAVVTARARLGIAYDWIVGYVTGGPAFINSIDYLRITIGGRRGDFLPMSNTAMGWAVGGGVEFAVWDNKWSAKVEYLYLRVTNLRAHAAIPDVLGTGIASESAEFHDNIVRLGVNYRFGPASRSASPAPAYLASYPSPADYAYPSVATQDVRHERKIRQVEPQQPAQRRAPRVARSSEEQPISGGTGLIELPILPERRRVQHTAEPSSVSHDAAESEDSHETQKLNRALRVCRGC